MPKNILTFGTINKRLTSRNSGVKVNVVNESNIIEKAYKVVSSRLENFQNNSGSFNIIKLNMDRMLESLADSTTANKFGLYPISIIEKMNATEDKQYLDYADNIATLYSSNIVPYVESIEDLISNISEYKITEKQKSIILKEAANYIAADRVINNHNIIKKRFNLEEVVLKYKNNLKCAVESICNMIDTYNREPFQKVNICVEETLYLIEKNNIPCNKPDIVNYILEYFLLSSPKLSDRNYNGFKKSVMESCFLSDNDISIIKYINTRDFSREQSSSIKQCIDDYYIEREKTEQSFIDTVTSCLNSDIIDLSYNFKDIIEFICTAYKSENLITDSELEDAMNQLDIKISSRIIELINNTDISQELYTSIINTVIDRAELIKQESSIYPRLYQAIEHFKKIIEAISPYLDFLYDNNNIETIKKINNCKEEIPVQEGHIFRGHNLIVAIRNLDKYLGDKCKEFTNKLFGKTNKKISDKLSVREKISNFLFTDEDKWFSKKLKQGKKNFDKCTDILGAVFASYDFSNFNAYSYISEDSKMFDMTLATLPLKSEEQEDDVSSTLASVCKDFNYILEANYDLRSFKVYYMINPGEATLHLVECHKFILDEEAITKIHEANYPDIEHACLQLAEASHIADLVDTINNKDLENSLFSFFKDGQKVSVERFDTILEALSILEVDKSIVDKFTEKYRNHIYYSITEDTQLDDINKTINSISESYQVEESELSIEEANEIKLEAYLALDYLLENDDLDNEDDDDYEPDDKESEQAEKEEIKKNPYKGINLKGIKLALMGLKKKFRNMSQKEKELAKGVDVSFKHLVDSFRNAMISDSREAIIKGSVIPSFSKCLKIGVPAAIGISKGLVNPGVAAIAALGSFAVSKHITKKERMIILDEIETELEVVEKEINMAERDEDMKKYRALLQYKKNLQRQYQRIKYNVKLGRIPSADTGIKID